MTHLLAEGGYQIFTFSSGEKTWLYLALLCAVAAVVTALLLVRGVLAADQGTATMKDIAKAIQEGAEAFLSRQFKTIAIIVVPLAVLIFFTATKVTHVNALGQTVTDLTFAQAGIYRVICFLAGAVCSGLTGFIGMSLAVRGNVRTAAAAREGKMAPALKVAFRTGAITGLFCVGLGLLGATTIVLIFQNTATSVLIGFGFGASLLALFMRVGGGIFTKAADVGADLVGKIEKDIPEDDPRNAATIADNVGDNVGDCAGMAADIFESYEVTIVAAMILGMATFGHKGVIFPLLVRGIGVLGSIISTYTVKAGQDDTSDTALKSVHRGFWIGSIISVAGFFILGWFYLRFEPTVNLLKGATPDEIVRYWGTVPSQLAWWANFGVQGLDLRPAITCLIGVFLAVALNKVTSYYTHTSHAPVKALTKACTTGHATNIIEGFALGYESTVAMLCVIVVAIFLSVLTYAGTPPMFIAYGVAMTGIGMLTLTGNTISMDVFGPVADNANGIGEMGYDKDEMEKNKPGSYKRARQILADLDAVGNTTKAETKGIAIGSAVIAAVSLFSSFIAVIAVGGEDQVSKLKISQYLLEAGRITVADPRVFIGFLLGGAVPFLFSSELIRAVGRAAYYIVQECRVQFKDAEIWAGTKKPDYGRVVDICTNTAQKELVVPGLLAIASPLLVGFLLGPYALGGFLAGMILVGQLLAVFMANAGGAWDNAKKLIEDGIYGGKGSEAHKAAVTGDTVGDPLKDTAGPAINPLVKVMNMVAMLSLTSVVLSYNMAGVKSTLPGASEPNALIGAAIAAVFVVLIIWAVVKSKGETAEMQEVVGSLDDKVG